MTKPIIVSWSELDAGRQCRYKHHLAYNQRYSKPVADDSPLGKGVLWHEVIELRYNIIHSHQIVNAEGRTDWDCSGATLEGHAIKAVDDFLAAKLKEGYDPDVISLMHWMHDGYVATYGLDEEHDIIGVETTHLAPLGNITVWRQGVDGWGSKVEVPVVLKFKIDRTVRDKFGQVRVIDEKSHATLPSDHDYDFLDQFGLYVWGLRKLGIDVRGAIHSASKTKRNQGDIFKPGHPSYKPTMKETELSSRFKRTPIHYTPAQLRGIAADALADVQELYSERNRHQRQADSDRCKWRCQYTEACLFGRRTGKPGDTVRMLEIQGFTQERERH